MSSNIILFGKNYQDHMLELGDNPVDKPVIFTKPSTTLRLCEKWNETISLFLPEEETHYECELVFKLKSGGFQLSKEEARNALDCYTVGLDMTKRNLQKKLKDAGHPWTVGKAFPDAAVIGPWIAMDNLEACLAQLFSFSINNTIRQQSTGSSMLFSPIDLIIYASQFFPLAAGDILFTGTPSGVGKVNAGDVGYLQLGKKGYSVVWDCGDERGAIA